MTQERVLYLKISGCFVNGDRFSGNMHIPIEGKLTAATLDCFRDNTAKKFMEQQSGQEVQGIEIDFFGFTED